MAADPSDEARLKKEGDVKRKAERARDGAAAMAQYEADAHATRAKTARLRALRLAKEAEEAAVKAAEPPKVKPVKRATGTKRAAASPSAKKTAKGASLSTFLNTQQTSGRRS